MKAKVIYNILFLTGEDLSILCRLRERDGRYQDGRGECAGVTQLTPATRMMHASQGHGAQSPQPDQPSLRFNQVRRVSDED